MTRIEQLYNILKHETPTNHELAKRLYGRVDDTSLGNIRTQLATIRRLKKVQIIADEFGHYKMSRTTYTWQDSQMSFSGKKGRPRHYVTAA